MDEAIPAWRQASGARIGTCAERMISAIRAIGILCFALAAGCAVLKERPPGAMARPLIVDPSLIVPKRDGAVAPEAPRSEAIQEDLAPPPPARPRQPAMTRDEVIGNEPVARAPAPHSKTQSTAKAAP